jgi:hypothetical protein
MRESVSSSEREMCRCIANAVGPTGQLWRAPSLEEPEIDLAAYAVLT